MYRTVVACRACGSRDLSTVLDLGNLAVSDFPPLGTDPATLDRAPLELCRCAACTLVQLRHTVDRDRLYRTYHYRSGTNETMVAALADVVADATTRVTLEPGDAVLDIGANDGTLLAQYPTWLNRIGFEPSQIAEETWKPGGPGYGCNIVHDYFPPARVPVEPVPCKVVTAIAVFYDLDDPGAFLDEVTRWLHPEGVLVLQFQDLGSMVRANGFDNICHEHLTYWDVPALERVLLRHGLTLQDATRVPINGGSLRVVARPTPFAAFTVGRAEQWSWSDDFALRVNRARSDTLGLLHRLWCEGKTVYGIAASTKFNTLSQYFGLDGRLIQAIGERSPAKWGTQTVTGIPIVNEEAMRAANPDYLFCCAWQFAEAFAERERALLERGTKLIVPLPELRIIGQGEADVSASRLLPGARVAPARRPGPSLNPPCSPASTCAGPIPAASSRKEDT